MPKKKPLIKHGPMWDWTKGLTQSAIELWTACREQFYLGYVEGWTPRSFSTPLEFGSMFHFMLERLGTSTPETIAREVCKSYYTTRKKTIDAESQSDLELALANAQTLFPLYVRYYLEEDSKLLWLNRERQFEIEHRFNTPPYSRLDTPNTIKLRGMRDGDYRTPAGGLGLFETKTKSSIDDVAIQSGLRGDLQTMLYLYSLQREHNEVPQQILYNVVRRPQLRLKKNEGLDSYCLRLAEDVEERPSWYFRRYEVDVTPGDIEIFIETTLDPVLRCMVQWWESIKASPHRWASPYHYRSLPALQNKYGRARLYNLMILGRTNEYYHRSFPFPELDENLLETK